MRKRKHPWIGLNNKQDVSNCSRNVGIQVDGDHHRAENANDEVNTIATKNDDIDIIHNFIIHRLINNIFYALSMGDN